MPPQLKIQGVNIVLRGNFNPAMFHPSWLAVNGLISNKEAEAAKVEIVAPPITSFKTEWLQVSVTEDRFLVATSQEPYYEPLRDLVISVLSLLNYVPLRVMGINRNFHYELESEEAWHAVGDRLVPKSDLKEVITKPGLKSLLIEGVRPDELEGYIRVKVEPSGQANFGVFLEINDHYQLISDPESLVGVKVATDILSSYWNETMERGLKIAQKIVSLGELK
jgi:hypothetical protein